MTETQTFAIDILKIVPDESVCFVQAPSIDKSEITNLLQPSEYDYYKQIILTEENKIKFIAVLTAENIEIYFQYLEIMCNNLLLFKAHDGMEIGFISKNINIPEWFSEKYIRTNICIVSKDF